MAEMVPNVISIVLLEGCSGSFCEYYTKAECGNQVPGVFQNKCVGVGDQSIHYQVLTKYVVRMIEKHCHRRLK